jgi:hypothetical protein
VVHRPMVCACWALRHAVHATKGMSGAAAKSARQAFGSPGLGTEKRACVLWTSVATARCTGLPLNAVRCWRCSSANVFVLRFCHPLRHHTKCMAYCYTAYNVAKSRILPE